MKKVYGLPTCSKCKELTKKYDEDLIEYEYIDLANNPEKIAYLRSKGVMNLPYEEDLE